MIRRIYSTLQMFKELSLKPGLNILMAETRADSTDKQTRNRAGKSSMVELIHFLTGGKCGPESIFRNAALLESTFGMDFDVNGTRVVAERTGSKPAVITFHNTKTLLWPFQPSSNDTLSVSKWNAVLGTLLFGLKADEDQEDVNRWQPTFRSLFNYFVRRQSAGAFTSPFKQSEMQQLGDQQIALSYLIGLDWTISQQWQAVRERERTLRELKKAAAQAAFGMVIGTTAELRTRLAVAEDRVESLRSSLSKFQILAEYRDLEAEASDLTIEFGRLADENTIDRRLLSELRKSTQAESAPTFDDLHMVYKAAGVDLPGIVLKRFADVIAFHQSIIENRKSYLAGETDAAEKRLRTRTSRMQEIDRRRSEVMAILKAHGALDQYAQMQSELSRVEAEAESLRQQFAAAENIEGQKTELEIERGRLRMRLLQDFKEQATVLREAIVTFEDVSNALYEKAGSLTVKDSLNGPEFGVQIHGSRSKGISNMQIFCFDVMLMRLCRERGLGPDFLMHDSHLFDGVDARQVATALQVGAEMSEMYGFQYIVTMNSDVFSTFAATSDFAFESHVMSTRLTDATEDGGLFGMRFG